MSNEVINKKKEIENKMKLGCGIVLFISRSDKTDRKNILFFTDQP